MLLMKVMFGASALSAHKSSRSSRLEYMCSAGPEPAPTIIVCSYSAPLTRWKSRCPLLSVESQVIKRSRPRPSNFPATPSRM